MDQLYKKGLTVGQLIEFLSKLKKKDKVLLSQDEEFNVIYEGIGISFGDGDVTLFPLTGTEIENDIVY